MGNLTSTVIKFTKVWYYPRPIVFKPAYTSVTLCTQETAHLARIVAVINACSLVCHAKICATYVTQSLLSIHQGLKHPFAYTIL